MNHAYAINARDLLESRKHGHRPGSVTVSLVRVDGRCDELALYLRPDMAIDRMDWRMVVDLDLVVLADASVPLDRVLQVCADLGRAKPRTLVLQFLDGTGFPHTVDIGAGCHRRGVPEQRIPPEHSFFWLPINTAGTRIGGRLKAALRERKPQGLNA